MKALLILIILAAAGYGVYTYYGADLKASFDKTVERTADFATDKAVKNTNINSDGSISEAN